MSRANALVTSMEHEMRGGENGEIRGDETSCYRSNSACSPCPCPWGWPSFHPFRQQHRIWWVASGRTGRTATEGRYPPQKQERGVGKKMRRTRLRTQEKFHVWRTISPDGTPEGVRLAGQTNQVGGDSKPENGAQNHKHPRLKGTTSFVGTTWRCIRQVQQTCSSKDAQATHTPSQLSLITAALPQP